MQEEKSGRVALTERLAEWTVVALQNRHSPDGFFRRTILWFRRALWLVSILYAVALLTLLGAFRFVGEQIPLVAFLLYLPPLIWTLPAFALVPICLIVRPALSLLPAGCLSVVCIVLMGWRWGTPSGSTGSGLTVVSNNRGQDNRQSLMPFVQAENPDLLLLQEDGRAAAFATVYPDRFCISHGEFTLVSKFPITDSGPVNLPNSPSGSFAARYVVDFQGQPLVVYNVHLPTPRDELYKLRGRSLLAASLPLPGRKFKEFREHSRTVWRERVDLAISLAAVINAETRPVIAAGDFNMPQCGYVNRQFAAGLCDSFAERGRGWGFTFPGVTRNPLSFFGPWLRIDYIFSNHRLLPLYARTESNRHSQHRAVAARFELIK